MVVVYLPAPIFNRPMPLMRTGGSREETDISLIKIDSIHCLPSSLLLKGWLAIAKLTPLSLFISLLLMPNEAFDNVKLDK